MAEEYVLQMCNISKSFGGTYACSNVNFNVSPGTVHALLGENGAGKSTLMKVLGGVHAADSGEIYISGQKVKIDSVQKSIASGVAMIHQELSQIPKLSVAENFCVGSEPVLQHFPLVIDKKKMIKTASDVFRRLGLNIDPTMRMGDLSIAEMQMVEIAKAVSRNAKIVIMDEPTSAITDREVEKLFEIIESLKRQGTAIIYISHKMDEVFRISDMISVMRDGHMIGTQKACDLTEEKLVPMLVGREITDYYSHESTTPGDVILEVRNLSRKGKFEDISFSVRKGEILGIAGLMGAGRTEIVETIFGVAQATSGEVLVNGKKAVIRSPHDAIKLGIGFVPEDRKLTGLNVIGSIRHNLTLVYLKQLCRLGQVINSRKEKVTSAELIKKLMVKMASDMNPVNSLSGGNQQKVVIAKWLMGDPQIIILDDPTRGIDVGAKAEIQEQHRRVTHGVNRRLKDMNVVGCRVLIHGKGEVFIAPCQIALVRAPCSPKSSIPGSAFLVIAYEKRIVICCRLVQKLFLNAVECHSRMDTSAVQIFLYLRGVFIQLRHQKVTVGLLLLVIRDRLFHCGVSKDGFHSIYEGVVLDLYQIIKRRSPSNVIKI